MTARLYEQHRWRYSRHRPFGIIDDVVVYAPPTSRVGKSRSNDRGFIHTTSRPVDIKPILISAADGRDRVLIRVILQLEPPTAVLVGDASGGLHYFRRELIRVREQSPDRRTATAPVEGVIVAAARRGVVVNVIGVASSAVPERGRRDDVLLAGIICNFVYGGGQNTGNMRISRLASRAGAGK